MLTTAATVAVLGFMGYRLFGAARYSMGGAGRLRVREIVWGIRLRHLLPVPFVIAAVISAALIMLQVPLLQIGWWSAIGGIGNPVAGSTEQTAGTALEWLIPLVFIVMLFPAIPLFAEREEEMFRLGAEGWSWPRRAWKALAFGMVHVVIGIPIGVAMALSIGGAYFQAAYLRGFRHTADQRQAVLESTRAHVTYNATLMALVLVAVVLTAFGF